MQNAKVSISPATESAPTTIEFDELGGGALSPFLAPPPPVVPPANIHLRPGPVMVRAAFYSGYRVVQISAFVQPCTDFAAVHAKYHPAAVKFKSLLL